MGSAGAGWDVGCVAIESALLFGDEKSIHRSAAKNNRHIEAIEAIEAIDAIEAILFASRVFRLTCEPPGIAVILTLPLANGDNGYQNGLFSAYFQNASAPARQWRYNPRIEVTIWMRLLPAHSCFSPRSCSWAFRLRRLSFGGGAFGPGSRLAWR
jgi:hypothetical protein